MSITLSKKREKILLTKLSRKDTIVSNETIQEKQFIANWDGRLVKHRQSGLIKSIIVLPEGKTISDMIKVGKYNPDINITYGTFDMCRSQYELVQE